MDVDDGDEYNRILEDGEEYSEEFWVGLRELEQQCSCIWLNLEYFSDGPLHLDEILGRYLAVVEPLMP